MIELHPEIVVKDEKQFVILPYEEFAAIQDDKDPGLSPKVSFELLITKYTSRPKVAIFR